MSDISPDKNRYTLNWIIEDFNDRHLSQLDSKEIRSPFFTADNLGQSSWFLAIHYLPPSSSSGGYPRARCSIARCSEDEGPEKIFIQFQFSATSPDGYYSDRKVRDASKVIAFEKGNSCVGCDLEYNQNGSWLGYSKKFLVLKYQMTEYSSAKNPVSRGSTIRSKINNINWNPERLLEMKLLSGPRGVQYEIFFHELNDIISIRIRRSDSNDSTECCLFCSLKAGSVNLYPKKTKDSLYKTFLINDTFDVPTSLKKNSFSGSEFQYSTNIQGFILTSFLINVSSKPEGKLSEKSTAHEFDSADAWRKEQLRMYEDGMHADVKLQVGSKSIPVHKCVLASHSPVFSAMFDEEEQTGIVSISDVDESTLDALLKYLYATVVEGLDFESASKLLEAADQYQVVPLREKCAAYLRDGLSVENAFQVLAVVAEKTSHQDLKSQAMDYIRAHADEILVSDSCIQLTRNNRRLMAEILTAMSY